MEIASLPLPDSFIRACHAKGIRSLYPPQAECIEKGLLEGKNLLISIPTASGKTLLAEMAMWSRIAAGGKCLYIVPLRALASEKYDEFSKKGVIRVGIATGDLDRTDAYLGENDIIVATSEKTDSLLRNRTPWLSQITCIVLDEVHLIGSENRGATLEMVITKLRYTNPVMQIIGLSATIGNPAQLAEWLDATLITSTWRPVDLRQGVYYNGKIRFSDSERPIQGKTKHDDLNLCLDTIEEGGQCLVFVSSRRNAEGFAKKAAGALKAGSPDSKALAQELRRLRDRDEGNVLADCVERGAAFHHAGLIRQERTIIEEGFRNGYIEVIAATPTLAAGLNLPARRVIIRDYNRFASGLGMVPIPVGEYHQMAGRAGRPDYHDLGKVVILAEPGASYVRNSPHTEEEVAMRLLKGEMEEVAPEHDLEASSEEFAANAVVCNGNERDLDRICSSMVGTLEPVLPVLIERGLAVRSEGRIELSDMARIMAEHFIGVERLTEILALTQKTDDPLDILTELECSSREQDREKRVKKRRR